MPGTNKNIKTDVVAEPFEGFEPDPLEVVKTTDGIKYLLQGCENELMDDAKSWDITVPVVEMKKDEENMAETDVINVPPPPPVDAKPVIPVAALEITRPHVISPALSNNSLLSGRSRTNSPASNISNKSVIDISNPAFKVPFDCGWRRELVTRSTVEDNGRQTKDVYYYHPTGKKLRSMREISQYLTANLTLDNFTFARQPLGVGPEYETIRNARVAQSPSDFIRKSFTKSPSVGSKSPSAGRASKSPSISKSPLVTDENKQLVKTEGKTKDVDVKVKRKSLNKSGNKALPKKRKSFPKVMLKKNGTFLAERKSPKVMLQKLEALAVDPLSPDGPRKKITKRRNPSAGGVGSNNIEGLAKKSRKSRDSSNGGGMEIGTLPPTWSPTRGKGQESWSQLDTNNYSSLLHVFQYLKVQELLRAARVCRLWRDLSRDQSLWTTVRLKNSQVTDWKGFADYLSERQTKNLDLRKMYIPLNNIDKMWECLISEISRVHSLERIDLCRCSTSVVEAFIRSSPNLLIFNATMIGIKDAHEPQILDLTHLSQFTKLKELRMKSSIGLTLTGSLKALESHVNSLTTLSMTTVKTITDIDVDSIGCLTNLETLELGECSLLLESFSTMVIAKLTKLRRIRLEKGQLACPTNEIIAAISSLPSLEQLELVNFDIKPGFDKAIASCTNIKRLLLIPTYVTQSATTNNIVLNGTYKMWKTLQMFTWVVTMELLKVTELFVDQCEGKNSRRSGGNSVPVLKPIPIPEATGVKPTETVTDDSKKPPPITVIPITELSEMLSVALPTTVVKVTKVPFLSTWRQTLTESTSLPSSGTNNG